MTWTEWELKELELTPDEQKSYDEYMRKERLKKSKKKSKRKQAKVSKKKNRKKKK